MFKKKDKIVADPYRSMEYVNAIREATEKNPEDVSAQLNYIRKQYGAKFHVMRMAEISHIQLNESKAADISFHPIVLRNMMSAFMDAFAHMQEDLPDGVYNYIENKSDSFFYKCIEETKSLEK
ncbi:hypothetical protein [Bacillus sp. Hm123]|uniref:hypothetical protein n=1 Tax=Bacillus sp. Hm123 TaxID=3450745 RepID=UPI003F435B2B